MDKAILILQNEISELKDRVSKLESEVQWHTNIYRAEIKAKFPGTFFCDELIRTKKVRL
jgi:hypothetical protein